MLVGIRAFLYVRLFSAFQLGWLLSTYARVENHQGKLNYC